MSEVTRWRIDWQMNVYAVTVESGTKGMAYETGPDLAWVLNRVLEKLA
jgi:hypothetical protein